MIAAITPYWGKNFFEFFSLLFQRLLLWLRGDLPLSQLASDEIQLLVLMIVALSSSLVGVFLVLKRMTMLANSLSHTLLLGIVLAYIILGPFSSLSGEETHAISLTTLLVASLATALLTTLLTQLLTHVMRLQEDASIGLVFTTLFALGIVLVTVFTRNAHIGTEVIMGNVDALHFDDLKLVFWVALVDLLILGLFYKEFQITAFDGQLASALGFSPALFNYILMILVAGTAIGAFRAVGVLLVLAFLVGPPLTARLLTPHLKTLILLAAAIGVFCSLIGVALARHILSVYHAPLSTGGLVVTLIGLTYGGVICFRLTKNRLRPSAPLHELPDQPPR